MSKCFNAIKNFMLSMFTQDEDIGLKSLEKKNVELITPKYKLGDMKISDIMKR